MVINKNLIGVYKGVHRQVRESCRRHIGATGYRVRFRIAFGPHSNRRRIAGVSQAYRRRIAGVSARSLVNQTVGISAQSVIGFEGLGWQYGASDRSFLIDFVSPCTA